MAVPWEGITSGALTIAVVCGVARHGFGRLKEIAEKTMTIDMCHERHAHIIKDLDRGDENFSKIQDTLDGQGKLLARLDTKMDLVLKNNGHGNEWEG